MLSSCNLNMLLCWNCVCYLQFGNSDLCHLEIPCFRHLEICSFELAITTNALSRQIAWRTNWSNNLLAQHSVGSSGSGSQLPQVDNPDGNGKLRLRLGLLAGMTPGLADQSGRPERPNSPTWTSRAYKFISLGVQGAPSRERVPRHTGAW